MVSSTTISIILLIVMIAPTLGFYIGSVAINIQKYTAGQCQFPEGVCAFGQAIGFPQGWLAPDTFIWYGIIPIMGVWLTIYGFMDKIKIFNGAITAGLSFVIAFSTIPLGLFVVMVVALYQLMGIYATVGLAILFLVGVFFEVRNRVGGMSGEYTAYNQQIKNFDTDMKSTKDKLHETEKAYQKATEDLKKEKNTSTESAILHLNEVTALRKEVESQKNQLKSKEALRKRFKTLWQKTRK
jgi:flagellar biosynthesis chaperone FliJ